MAGGSAEEVSPVMFVSDIRVGRLLNSTSTADCPSLFTDSPEVTLIIPLND